MPNSVFAVPVPKAINSGIGLMCMEEALSCQPKLSPGLSYYQKAVDLAACPHVSSPLLKSFILATCMENPFWNEFRLLDFFNRNGLKLTIQELQHIKRCAGIETKTALCQALTDLHTENSQSLNAQQIRFVERLNPVFCDREISVSYPGELLAYECICTRRMVNKLKSLQYIHLFIDLYNGYVFGKFMPQRSLDAALALFRSEIAPVYAAKNYNKPTILYYSPDGQIPAASSLSLQAARRPSGTIQGFRKFILAGFFEGIRIYDTPVKNLPYTFERWLQAYNLTRPFDRRQNLLRYSATTFCPRLSID
ncbi:hypothetical protein P22_1011 [Propionispora sp. 2/2-37]|uniref:hypothetical protein n=1 Tax=Propionispora sp. 2/2-37 TaxID=1677858 RepID=UPI0006BB6D4C|nr:hypothetical protein [Propionispora sp. 2/2-37]CUH94942.1 hypothetical protein P22_1011 [Propionispora sp. 2/2-37]